MDFEQRLRRFQASWINRKRSISERIGIVSNPDKELFLLYLMQKIEGNDAYTARSIAQIGAPKTEMVPIINLYPRYWNTWARVFERQQRETEMRTGLFVEQNYQTDVDRQRARQIQLAVNDLIAKATYSEKPRIAVHYRLDAQLLNTWGERWFIS